MSLADLLESLKVDDNCLIVLLLSTIVCIQTLGLTGVLAAFLRSTLIFSLLCVIFLGFVFKDKARVTGTDTMVNDKNREIPPKLVQRTDFGRKVEVAVVAPEKELSIKKGKEIDEHMVKVKKRRRRVRKPRQSTNIVRVMCPTCDTSGCFVSYKKSIYLLVPKVIRSPVQFYLPKIGWRKGIHYFTAGGCSLFSFDQKLISSNVRYRLLPKELKFGRTAVIARCLSGGSIGDQVTNTFLKKTRKWIHLEHRLDRTAFIWVRKTVIGVNNVDTDSFTSFEYLLRALVREKRKKKVTLPEKVSDSVKTSKT